MTRSKREIVNRHRCQIPTADWNQELQQFNRASHKWNNVLLTIGYVVCLGAVAYLGLWLAGAP